VTLVPQAMPAIRLALLCSAADRVAVEERVADLSGLLCTSDVSIEDAEAVASLVQRQALNDRFLLHFERDELLLCRRGTAGGYLAHRASVAVSEVTRRPGKLSEVQRACLGERKNHTGVTVLDCFAGWGIDALTLAAAGAQVTCAEIQPALCALVRDLCRRAGMEVTTLHADALTLLGSTTNEPFDVVYLDPMFPERKKGALPGKRLQWLAELLGTAGVGIDRFDELQLIQAAQQQARTRVVLKRRRTDPVVGEPTRQLKGSSVRYDVYSGGA